MCFVSEKSGNSNRIMAKSLHKFVKFSSKELETYTQTEGLCVLKVNTNMHFALAPYCIANFKRELYAHIMRRKVGHYDLQLDGIVLDVKNIKVLGSLGAIRADDPAIHVDLNADCYVFRPTAGAILSGVVKHVGTRQVGVIIYRVFNAKIHLTEKLEKDEVQLEQVLKFRIKNFDLQNVFPYITGELLSHSKKDNEVTNMNEEAMDSAADSDIEENDLHEHNEIITLIKEESTSEDESMSPKKHTKTVKQKRMSVELEEAPLSKIKTEDPKKKKKLVKSVHLEQSIINVKIEAQSSSDSENTIDRHDSNATQHRKSTKTSKTSVKKVNSESAKELTKKRQSK